MKEIKILLK
jgi:hypothetical protein